MLASKQAFYIFIIQVLAMNFLLARNAPGQSLDKIKVTIQVKDATLAQIFNKLESLTAFTFGYNEKVMADNQKLSLNYKEASLLEVLNHISETAGLDFKRINDTISITGRKKPEKTETASYDFIINGKVTDENGAPLPGANVIVKGTSIGTNTDMDGNYALEVPDDATVLLFSYIGYVSEEVEIAGRSVIDMALLPDVTSLEEITVSTGYWETKEKLNPGNIAKVDARIIEQQPISNPLQAIQGRMAGVYVEQVTGVPGGGFNINIRGVNSLRDDGNDPLYLVDGVPFPSQSLESSSTSVVNALGNPLSTINPNDIESIEVLKDADATAIYGSRGANGVVLIKTKQGQTGEARLDIRFSQGVGEVTNRVELLNTQQHLEVRKEALSNDGFALRQSLLERRYPDIYVWDTTRYTDWQEELLGGAAQFTNANISLSGGNNITSFVMGGGFFRETTVFPGENDFTRASGRFNLSHASSNGKLQASVSANYTVSLSNLPGSDLTLQALTLPPNAPALYDEEGNLNWENGTWNNPLSTSIRRSEDRADNLVTNANIRYQLFQGFNAKLIMGYNNLRRDESATFPLSSRNPAELTDTSTASTNFANGNVKTWIIEPQAEYFRSLGKGELSFLAGATFQNTISERETIQASGFSTDAFLLNPQAATMLETSNYDYAEYRYNAVFARLNYTWSDKYILNLTGRRDGSSRFGPGLRFGNFGAVGMAWIFSEEGFVKNTLPFLNFGKFRASYGSTGNDQIGNYRYLESFSFTTTYGGIRGLTVTRLANPEFSWETVTKLEAGLELGFFQDRVFGSVSWFRNRATDQLIGFPLSEVTGDNIVQFNFPATVENRGWEFEINTTNIDDGQWKWTTAINLTLPENELVAFPNIEEFPFYDNRYIIGRSIVGRSGKVLEFEGVEPETGVYRFRDFNADGTINDFDRQKFIEVGQEYFGGVQNSVRFKAFQLDFLFQFVRQTGVHQFAIYFQSPGGFSNQPAKVLEGRWRQPGDVGMLQRFSDIGSELGTAYSQFNSRSDVTFVNTSFVRLRNVAFSYVLPPPILSRLKIQNLRIFLEGQNLITFTGFEGFDPETNGFSIPPLRIMTAGFNITL